MRAIVYIGLLSIVIMLTACSGLESEETESGSNNATESEQNGDVEQKDNTSSDNGENPQEQQNFSPLSHHQYIRFRIRRFNLHLSVYFLDNGLKQREYLFAPQSFLPFLSRDEEHFSFDYPLSGLSPLR